MSVARPGGGGAAAAAAAAAAASRAAPALLQSAARNWQSVRVQQYFSIARRWDLVEGLYQRVVARGDWGGARAKPVAGVSAALPPAPPAAFAAGAEARAAARAAAVAGARAAKAADGESRKRGREDKTTIKLTLAYYGPAFSGYAYQPSPDEPTVQRSVQDAIWSAAAR